MQRKPRKRIPTKPPEVPQTKLSQKEIQKVIKAYLKDSSKLTLDPSKLNVREISGYDKLQALIRIPKVREDSCLIKGEPDPKKKLLLEIEFEQKYGIFQSVIEKWNKLS